MIERLSITVLSENTAGARDLLAEHGLSFWIEADGHHILFDTGQGLALANNARVLGIDLRQAEAIVLSHGHYDHTGGLYREIDSFRRASVYTHLTAFQSRFSRGTGGRVSQVGSPVPNSDWLQERVEKLYRVRTPSEIAPGVWLTGEIPRRTDFEDTGGAFFLDEACTEPDEIVDDQALVLQTRRGTILLVGCAHAGVVNTLCHVAEMTGGRQVHAVIGGMHLHSASPERLEKTIAAFRAADLKLLAPGHCTGARPAAMLWSCFAEKWRPCPVGSRFDFTSPSPS
jgi:7,8-dihydropterin-6-yl-methyl-4-(beta-D-ribofuranosyl)aminobenzene 5'-phosphate synthase